MLRPYTYLSALLLLLLCACGPPSSTDPSAKDNKLVLYDYENAEPDTLTATEAEIIKANIAALRSSMNNLRMALAVMPGDYPSVAEGTTELTEQRAGGTERMANLPDRGTNVGMTFDSITAYNRDLLNGATELGEEADNYFVIANDLINEAKAEFVLAKAANDWPPATADEWEGPIERAEAALAEATRLRESLREVLID